MSFLIYTPEWDRQWPPGYKQHITWLDSYKKKQRRGGSWSSREINFTYYFYCSRPREVLTFRQGFIFRHHQSYRITGGGNSREHPVEYAENFRGGGRFRHNRVTSQINFRGSAEGTTILGGSGSISPGKVCKITPKNTHFCAFWKQVLDYTVYTFFIFRIWGGGHGTVASPLRTLVWTPLNNKYCRWISQQEVHQKDILSFS